MDAELKAKWIAALRSGEYTQNRNALFDWNGGCGLCCIGVAAVACLGLPVREQKMVTDTVAPMLGLSYDQKENLVTMNDSEKASFAEIADYIEANL